LASVGCGLPLRLTRGIRLRRTIGHRLRGPVPQLTHSHYDSTISILPEPTLSSGNAGEDGVPPVRPIIDLVKPPRLPRKLQALTQAQPEVTFSWSLIPDGYDNLRRLPIVSREHVGSAETEPFAVRDGAASHLDLRTDGHQRLPYIKVE
jgi:hypothetical protein